MQATAIAGAPGEECRGGDCQIRASPRAAWVRLFAEAAASPPPDTQQARAAAVHKLVTAAVVLEYTALGRALACWRLACSVLRVAGEARWRQAGAWAAVSTLRVKMSELEKRLQAVEAERDGLMLEVAAAAEELPPSPGAKQQPPMLKRSSSNRSKLAITPSCHGWVPRHRYACFLSHYKMEAASEARYLKDLLQRMIDTDVFLDSEDLVDLRDLFDSGVHSSDVLVVLCTEHIALRPWCLCEILEASRGQVPVMPVVLEGKGFSRELLEEQMANLEVRALPAIRRIFVRVAHLLFSAPFRRVAADSPYPFEPLLLGPAQGASWHDSFCGQRQL